jgi:hypothetical protein
VKKALRSLTSVTADNQSVISEDEDIRFRGARYRSLDFAGQRKAGSGIGNPFPAQSGEPFAEQRGGIAPDGPRNGVHGMHVQNYAVRQHGMHGSLD